MRTHECARANIQPLQRLSKKRLPKKDTPMWTHSSLQLWANMITKATGSKRHPRGQQKVREARSPKTGRNVSLGPKTPGVLFWWNPIWVCVFWRILLVGCFKMETEGDTAQFRRFGRAPPTVRRPSNVCFSSWLLQRPLCKQFLTLGGV